MPIPTHGPSCQTVIYPADCWHCGRPIHILQCTCGSAVLFDKPKPPWPEHDCSSGGIGGSGLSGWAAVDVLRANGIPIDANIMAKVFPAKLRSGKAGASPPPESMAAMQPKAGKKIDLVAIVRELLTDTKKTDRLNALGDIGAKLLKLPKGELWQLTHWTADAPTGEPECTFETVMCQACAGLHFINRSTGKILGENERRPPG